jgi:hypothetical protein
MIRHDYIIRVIQQAVQAIGRMLRLIERGDHEAARVQAEEAYDLLGVPADLAVRMDSPSLAMLLGQPEKIRLMAKLSWQEGQLLRATGDVLNGMDRYRRAAELMLEAQRLAPCPEDAAALQEMFRHIPTNALDERYRAEEVPLGPDH